MFIILRLRRFQGSDHSHHDQNYFSVIYASPFFLSRFSIRHVQHNFTLYLGNMPMISYSLFHRITIYIFFVVLECKEKATPEPINLFFERERKSKHAKRPPSNGLHHMSFCSPTGLINFPFSTALRRLSIHHISILV
jgi:hypothetical protein